MLVHVLDLAPLDGTDPAANYATVERELELHDPRLARLPRLLALSKADLVDAETGARAVADWSQKLGAEVPVFLISSVTRQGLDELAAQLLRQVPPLAGSSDGEPADTPLGAARPPGREEPALSADLDELAEHRVYRPVASRSYSVERIGDGSFRVSGDAVERLVARYDLDNEEALAHLERRLRGIGVIRALESQGFEPGDDVEIAGVAFELDPGSR